jgi:hypothetical protein
MKLMGDESIVSVGMGLRMIVLNREIWGDFGACFHTHSFLGTIHVQEKRIWIYVVSMRKTFVSYIFLTLFVFCLRNVVIGHLNGNLLCLYIEMLDF